ncbi:MAG: hypothetical protein Q9166_001460 [cf. Caloplaca sp. 2 TL-2023]
MVSYYCVLCVNRTDPPERIRDKYEELRNVPWYDGYEVDKTLVETAYYHIGDPVRRQAYDRQLKSSTLSVAVGKPTNVQQSSSLEIPETPAPRSSKAQNTLEESWTSSQEL